MALGAIPEEANAKELRLERRPELLLSLQSKAPEVLKHLCATGERTRGRERYRLYRLYISDMVYKMLWRAA